MLPLMKKQMPTRTPTQFLEYANKEFRRLHETYERYFWVSYMGDHSIDTKKDKALAERDAFASNAELFREVKTLHALATGEEKEKLGHWVRFFSLYQSPAKLQKLRDRISVLETKMHKKAAEAETKAGYIDPTTKKFVQASKLKMSGMIRSEKDEALRRAAFDGIQKLAYTNLKDYVKFVNMLNSFAQGLGFEDFYAYKIFTEEGMTKKELFKIFDSIHSKTKFAFKNIRELEKTKPGLRKPWNFGYMMSGSFTAEEDEYFPFDEALERWGKSFQASGISFHGGKLNLDLLERKGKYSNGFCHYPELVHFENNKRAPGAANFTCNVVYGQVGSAWQGYHTLFHEGGHAADRLNSEQTEVCLNTEYPPASTAWAETQSMFIDTMFASYEWRSRYAKNKKGEVYPFELFKRKVKELSVLAPLGLRGMMAVSQFEKEIYESKDLTPEEIVAIAKKNNKKYFDYSEDSLWLLTVPHIYSWTSGCSYHAYALAELALTQWRDYFYKKYGHVVDNSQVGEEMRKVWELGSSKTFKEFVQIATGKLITADAWLEEATISADEVIKRVQGRVKRLQKVPELKRKIELNAMIRMVDGKKLIADNKKSFEDMCRTYAVWLSSRREDKLKNKKENK
jgi:hypothetical protein